MYKQIACVLLIISVHSTAVAEDSARTFSPEEQSVADFWQRMGPTLRDEGIDAYAIRYHTKFRHWDIGGTGRIANKESAIGYWRTFHDEGHRITCTHVQPVTVDINDGRAFARMIYEQTNTYADGRIMTKAWRMIGVFEKYRDTWRALETNMVEFTPTPGSENDKPGATSYTMNCPVS